MPKKSHKTAPALPQSASVAARREAKKAASNHTRPESNAAHTGDCSICFDRLSRPTRLPCKHLFCLACIKRWAKVKNTCPLCKARFLKAKELDGSTGVELEERVLAEQSIPARAAQNLPQIHLNSPQVTLIRSGFPLSMYFQLPPL